MKKISLWILATLLVVALTTPAAAFENEFGGLWRARYFLQENFNGEGNGATDVARADQRTRLYYTAHFSESFKLINKFEMDATWGDNGATSYGDIGADGVAVEIKNTYADFVLSDLNFKIGTQHKTASRGILFDDDFSGVIARYVSDTVIFPLIWMRANEGGPGRDRFEGDVDYLLLDPRFLVSENIWLNPFVMYIHSGDASGWAATTGNQDIDVYFLGVNVDADMDFGSLWFTGIYEYGTVDTTPGSALGGDDLDVAAFVVAAGASVKAGPADIHGQLLYASGDDDPTDSDAEAFYVPKGQSYYWAEIMGLGVFDNQASTGAPGDQISNVYFGNIGASFNPMEDLTLKFDLWYACHSEDDPNGEDVLGTEADVRADYKLVENITLTAVGAYLFADDATSTDGKNDEDPYEVGIQLQFTF